MSNETPRTRGAANSPANWDAAVPGLLKRPAGPVHPRPLRCATRFNTPLRIHSRPWYPPGSLALVIAAAANGLVLAGSGNETEDSDVGNLPAIAALGNEILCGFPA